VHEAKKRTWEHEDKTIAHKSEGAVHEGKKHEFALFLPLPHHTRSPFPEPKAACQGEKARVLIKPLRYGI
jgi:hypothetical protein